jgi:hypothetical protein
VVSETRDVPSDVIRASSQVPTTSSSASLRQDRIRIYHSDARLSLHGRSIKLLRRGGSERKLSKTDFLDELTLREWLKGSSDGLTKLRGPYLCVQ